MIKRLILGLLLLVLIVLFTLNNTAPTNLVIVGLNVSLPLALLLVICLALGAAIAILLMVSPALKERKKLKTYRQQVEALTRELAALKLRNEMGAEVQKPEPPDLFPPEGDGD